MNIKMHRYRGESDSQRIRDFLGDVFMKNGRHADSWPVTRWDYWRWYANETFFHFALEAAVFLWEAADGRLAGVLNPGRPGEAWLQVDPTSDTPEQEVDMINVAETQYALRQADGTQKLVIWSPQTNRIRQKILERRGYERLPGMEILRRKEKSLPIGGKPLPGGYSLRSLHPEELERRGLAAWKVFHPGEAEANYPGMEWYRNVQRAPLYKQELDLVAVGQDGEIAAFCTAWYDLQSQTVAIEPLGVLAEHRRRGLGRALMIEGLRRAGELGASLAMVNSFSEEMEALCVEVGFVECDRNEAWGKQW